MCVSVCVGEVEVAMGCGGSGRLITAYYHINKKVLHIMILGGTSSLHCQRAECQEAKEDESHDDMREINKEHLCLTPALFHTLSLQELCS